MDNRVWPPKGGTPNEIARLPEGNVTMRLPPMSSPFCVPVLEIALAQGIGNERVKVKVLARVETMN
jgi:hypothetical protein